MFFPLWLFVCHTVHSSYYVGSGGEDKLECGTQEDPCKTITGLLKNTELVKTNDIVIQDLITDFEIVIGVDDITLQGLLEEAIVPGISFLPPGEDDELIGLTLSGTNLVLKDLTFSPPQQSSNKLIQVTQNSIVSFTTCVFKSTGESLSFTKPFLTLEASSTTFSNCKINNLKTQKTSIIHITGGQTLFEGTVMKDIEMVSTEDDLLSSNLIKATLDNDDSLSFKNKCEFDYIILIGRGGAIAAVTLSGSAKVTIGDEEGSTKFTNVESRTRIAEESSYGGAFLFTLLKTDGILPVDPITVKDILCSLVGTDAQYGKFLFIMADGILKPTFVTNTFDVRFDTDTDVMYMVDNYESKLAEHPVPLRAYFLTEPESLHVSPNDPIDHERCGYVFLPCATIQYAQAQRKTKELGVCKLSLASRLQIAEPVTFDGKTQYSWKGTDNHPNQVNIADTGGPDSTGFFIDVTAAAAFELLDFRIVTFEDSRDGLFRIKAPSSFFTNCAVSFDTTVTKTHKFIMFSVVDETAVTFNQFEAKSAGFESALIRLSTGGSCEADKWTFDDITVTDEALIAGTAEKPEGDEKPPKVVISLSSFTNIRTDSTFMTPIITDLKGYNVEINDVKIFEKDSGVVANEWKDQHLMKFVQCEVTLNKLDLSGQMNGCFHVEDSRLDVSQSHFYQSGLFSIVGVVATTIASSNMTTQTGQDDSEVVQSFAEVVDNGQGGTLTINTFGLKNIRSQNPVFKVGKATNIRLTKMAVQNYGTSAEFGGVLHAQLEGATLTVEESTFQMVSSEHTVAGACLYIDMSRSKFVVEGERSLFQEVKMGGDNTKGSGIFLLMKDESTLSIPQNIQFFDNSASVGNFLYVDAGADSLAKIITKDTVPFITADTDFADVKGTGKEGTDIPLPLLVLPPPDVLEYDPTGIDNDICGFKQYPCKTLKYSLEKQLSSDKTSIGIQLRTKDTLDQELITKKAISIVSSLEVAPELTIKDSSQTDKSDWFISTSDTLVVNTVCFNLPDTLSRNVFIHSEKGTVNLYKTKFKLSETVKYKMSLLSVVDGGDILIDHLELSRATFTRDLIVSSNTRLTCEKVTLDKLTLANCSVINAESKEGTHEIKLNNFCTTSLTSEADKLVLITAKGGSLSMHNADVSIGSAASSHNSIDQDEPNICQWATGLIKTEKCRVSLTDSTFRDTPDGVVSMKEGELILTSVVFKNTNATVANFPSFSRNVHCNGGKIIVSTHRPEVFNYAWFDLTNCEVEGSQTLKDAPLFVPTIEKIEVPKGKDFLLSFTGKNMHPCGLQLKVFKLVKGDPVQDQEFPVTLSSETQGTAKPAKAFKVTKEHRATLVYGNHKTATDIQFTIGKSNKGIIITVVVIVVVVFVGIAVAVCVVLCVLKSRKKKRHGYVSINESDDDGI
ncbi:hypothetical protein BLNAU_7637 [Blattamonas nauphoetae]|uniref:Uncharacterized protein n=1 Tax=Blattamonas nauphoetae TaxID=2049346 RepID=A0ABQ9Y165_9EUKA|nr:hypothetical protein BLNAU_7637 [Blattamonas nauphoetae]